MLRIRLSLIAILFAQCCSVGCTHQEKPASNAATTTETATTTLSTRSTILWISVDGLRGDYIARAKPAFLSKLAQEGRFTTQLTPAFPSLTFPSHTSEATGVKAGMHGISGNAFYDTVTAKAYSFPDDASLMQAEPIWLTAERQGVRTAVVDWPMSQRQTGPVKSAYFNPSYDADLSDADRIAKLVQFYRDDHDDNPLRLLMGYVHAVDTAGHKFGPDSPLVDDALRETDALLGHVVSDIEHAFDEKAKVTDELYILITTDHGMLPVKTMVNLQTLLGEAKPADARIIDSGSLGEIYLDQVPADERPAAAAKIAESLKGRDFLHVWTRSDLPSEFGFNNAARSGDVVVVCKPGYTLTSRLGAPRPALPADVKGMHGYDPAECPEMRGFAAIWRYRKPFNADGKHDLGATSTLQLAPTVAALLNIRPNPAATAAAIKMN